MSVINGGEHSLQLGEDGNSLWRSGLGDLHLHSQETHRIGGERYGHVVQVEMGVHDSPSVWYQLIDDM